MTHAGFLGTAAPLQADLVLLIELAMGLALLAGAWLTRKKQYRAHAICQSSIVLLNPAVIALTMAPSFSAQVLPRIPVKLAKPYIAVATTHAALGAIAEITALYILLSAGTNLLPQRFRIARFKPWMRTALALWWLTLLFGAATYIRWYAPTLFRK